MKKRKAQFSYVIWKEGRYFVAQCLNVDVSSFGRTRNEALKNLEEAVELYFENRPLSVPKVQSPSVGTKTFEYV